MKLIGQLKKIIRFSKADKKAQEGLGTLSFSLSDQLFDLLNKTFEDRNSNLQNTHYSKHQVEDIIEEYTKKNMLIAMAAAAVPGPLGMLSSGPEMIGTIGNHMKMIYDIGCAHDKENFLNKDSLIDIPLHAFGMSTNLHQLQNSPTDLMDSSTRILQEKINSFSQMMINKLVKKSVTKWIPVGGTVMMSVWAKMGTQKVADTAILFFDDQKTIPPLINSKSPVEENVFLTNRIKALINLIDADNHIDEEELKFILPIIENAPIAEDLKKQLLEEASELDSNLTIDFKILKKAADECDDLLMEMAILAKRNGEVNEEERKYFETVVKELGLDTAKTLSILEN